MKVDISKLINGYVDEITLSDSIILPKELLEENNIYDIDLKFDGNISLNNDNLILVTGKIFGIIVLPDNITLERVDCKIDTNLEEILEKRENILDISSILWQNILVEIPLKVRKNCEEVNMSGNGWRLISEDAFNKEHQTNNPFQDLNELFDSKEGE